MTWFPQTAAGSVQLPLRRRLVWRSITNRFENGERCELSDPAAGRIEWSLTYKDLSSEEADSLSTFFRNARGAFATFAFVDPTANLLGWSEDFSRPDWDRQLLNATAVAGPVSGSLAARFANNAGATQSLCQSLALPGSYTTCFSAWLRSDVPSTATLRRGNLTQSITTTPTWRRFFISGKVPGEEAATFAIEVDAGQSLDVWGPQVETSPYPSRYVPTTTAAGIYERTSFAGDDFALTATGPGRFATDITLVSRL